MLSAFCLINIFEYELVAWTSYFYLLNPLWTAVSGVAGRSHHDVMPNGSDVQLHSVLTVCIQPARNRPHSQSRVPPGFTIIIYIHLKRRYYCRQANDNTFPRKLPSTTGCGSHPKSLHGTLA